ncbi:BTAD domain-containing putative transcriptional regulator [Micromonospora purpureochromogenes]|uniref:DNA-binding SARP family transcriptional activator n=1 Tax=Micromonospora purpureochromogenes TaxID=47872 RepID=A0ABX2RFY4_9ACTN|nr:BTAD domain-containing putative transcriptional regulator [Micromonospora purpureochromogenes]NYF55415.1 DNA-binding SARP family transcriptional activator [Micromonospora purpureochromogenes]
MSGTLRFEILGPQRAWYDDREIDTGPGKQRAVLAVLLLAAGRAVPTGQIVDAVWPEDPPANGPNVVQKYVAGLRRVLEPDRSPRTPGQVLALTEAGYRLRVPPEAVDAILFERSVHRARGLRAEGRPADAVAELRAATDLWRGEPLAGLPGPLFDSARHRLVELRAAALETRAELELELGRHRELIGELVELVAEFPLRERLRHQLMLALYRSGRQAEALAVYREIGDLLREEYGIEPGNALQELHRRILRSDPALVPAGTAGQPAPPPPASPPDPAPAVPTPASTPAASNPPASAAAVPTPASTPTIPVPAAEDHVPQEVNSALAAGNQPPQATRAPAPEDRVPPQFDPVPAPGLQVPQQVSPSSADQDQAPESGTPAGPTSGGPALDAMPAGSVPVPPGPNPYGAAGTVPTTPPPLAATPAAYPGGPPPFLPEAPAPARARRQAPGWASALGTIAGGALALLSFGCFTWAVIGAYALWRRSWRLGLAAVGYLAAAAVAFGVLATGDPEAEPSYVEVVLVTGLVAVCWLLGAGHVVLLSRGLWQAITGTGSPPPDPLAEHRRVRREQARYLLHHYPAARHELAIGRPDLPRAFDDGGLVDINAVPDHVLAGLPGLSAEQRRQVVMDRWLRGPFGSMEELAGRCLLPPTVSDGLRDVLLFLPPVPPATPPSTAPR